MDIELNVSCPNVKNIWLQGLGRFICSDRTWCIIKLSPKADKRLIDGFYKEGFRQFHCSYMHLNVEDLVDQHYVHILITE